MNEQLKENIRKILWKENEINESYITVSDLQLWQQNLPLYEYDVRCKMSWATNMSLKELEDIKKWMNRKYDFHSWKQLLNKLMYNADKFVIEKYFKFINENDSEVIIDWWDFLFNPNEERISYYKKYFKKIFDQKKIEFKNRKRILILWNHDRTNQIEFYKTYFDEVKNYLFHFEWDKLVLITHEPITDRIEWIWRMKNIQDLIKQFWDNLEIKNIYWHTHSKEIHSEYDGSKLLYIEYENMCIDYYIKNWLKWL